MTLRRDQVSNRRTWIAALRSGKYTQIRHEGGEGFHRCALTVGVDATGQLNLSEAMGLIDGDYAAVIVANDTERLSFEEIADALELMTLADMEPDALTGRTS